jgi:hypothetical protein
MRKLLTLVTISIVVLLGAADAGAQTSTPQLIKVQGFLNQSGAPANGTFSMSFTLYDAQFPGGSVVKYIGPQSVSVTNGLYEVDVPLSISSFFTGSNRYLEINVNGEVLTPRMQMVSAPFCFQADMLDGFEALDFVKKAGDTMTGNLQVAGTIYSTTGGIRFPDGTTQTTASAGGGGGTLNQAYNYGGAGAGRTITANSGAVNIDGASGLTVNGNVGIGTTGPGYKLDVAGQVNSLGGFIASSGYSGTYGTMLSVPSYSRTRVLSAFWTGATGDYVDLEVPGNDGPGNRLRVTSRGNVGIGTDVPAYALDVAGQVKASSGFVAPWGAVLGVSNNWSNNRILTNGWGADPTWPANTHDYVNLEVPGATPNSAVFRFSGGGRAFFSALDLYPTAYGSSGVWPGSIWVAPGNGYGDGGVMAQLYIDQTTREAVVSAERKDFHVPNPAAPATDIWYSSMEGPEVAIYVRGTATLVNGRAVIELPSHFESLASDKGLTVQLTPLSVKSKGLAIIRKSLDGIEVGELGEGSGNYDFDWETKAVRKGHENFAVIHPWNELMPPDADMKKAWEGRLRMLRERGMTVDLQAPMPEPARN